MKENFVPKRTVDQHEMYEDDVWPIYNYQQRNELCLRVTVNLFQDWKKINQCR